MLVRIENTLLAESVKVSFAGTTLVLKAVRIPTEALILVGQLVVKELTVIAPAPTSEKVNFFKI